MIGHGGKFSPDGNPLYFPGNTFICHIDQTSNAHAALGELSDKIRNGPTGDYFTFLPPSSFHMTVFPAICGDPLGYDGWPAGTPQNTSLSDFNAIYAQRVAIRSAFAECRVVPIGTFCGTSLNVEGASASDQSKLRDARRMLCDVTGLERPDFDAYKFHITLCYRKRWMDESTARLHLFNTFAHIYQFQTSVPEILLGAIEFCSFKKMHSFKEIMFVPSG